MTTPLAAKIARDYGTPAAVIDMDSVERNIARIQAACDAAARTRVVEPQAGRRLRAARPAARRGPGLRAAHHLPRPRFPDRERTDPSHRTHERFHRLQPSGRGASRLLPDLRRG